METDQERRHYAPDENDRLRGKGSALPGSPVEDIVDFDPGDTPSGLPGSGRSSWWPIDLASIDTTAVDQPTILPRTDGLCLLYRGKVSSIVGEPCSCKSWLAQCAVQSVLKDGRRVLYFDLEDNPASVVARLTELSCTQEELARFLGTRSRARN